ncbi:MAG: PAS domain S-box protein [Candidatus Solibacter sp.]
MRRIWLTAAVAMLIAIAGYSYLDSLAFREAAAGAEQSRVLIEQANRVHRLLVTAEAGQRGYLLTGDPGYLADYQIAVPRIQAAVPLLAIMKAADEEDRARLPALITAKLAELQETIRTGQNGDSAEALAIVRTGRGKQTMQEIREALTRMLERENVRFREYSDSAQRHGFQTRVLAQLFALLLAGFIWFSGRRINRLANEQEELIAVLQATRARDAEGRAALATTLRSIGDAVIATDAQGRVDFMNPVAESLTGYSSAEAAGRPLPEVFRISNEDSQELSPDITAAVLRDGITVGLANHTVLSRKGGQSIPIDDSAAPILDDQGKITGVVLVFRDVTQRRAAQRSLEESASRYRLLFESNPQCMWVYEIGTLRFLAVNEAAIARYGYTGEEFLGMTLRDIRPQEDVALLEQDTRVPNRKLHTDGPWRHRSKSGAVFFVEITAHPLHFDGRSAKLVMATDITERLRLEENLRQSQKLEAVGQLAGGIAHDFNNLLTVIEGYAEMLGGELTPEDERRVPVKEILTAAQRAASLTRQLLAFSRRQILQPIRLSLNVNVQSTHRMLSRLLGEQIEIEAEPEAHLWDVFADPGQVDQIILNLAVNARDAMERGGTLTIRTANVSIESSVDAGLPEGEYVCLSVSDTGEGMDEETQSRIFEPFFTTKEVGRGTGLGLATVYGIVKQSGGHIRVASAVGKGSSFSIYLPRATGAVPVAAVTAVDAEPGGPEGEVILVVEDDANIRHMVASMLTHAGYQVLAPETPREAIDLCRDAALKIEMLLTDVVLPEIDGLEVAKQAVAARPRLGVLFMSGYTEHPVLRLPGFDHGAPFLHKPFTRAALLAKVSGVLNAL